MTFGGTDTLTVKVEQALAFGRSDTYITARLGVDTAEIQRVREWLEAVARHNDDPETDTGYCRKGLHATTPEDTYTDPRGRRYCRPCKQASRERERSRKAAA